MYSKAAKVKRNISAGGGIEMAGGENVVLAGIEEASI